jgi:hypothetical protein
MGVLVKTLLAPTLAALAAGAIDMSDPPQNVTAYHYSQGMGGDSAGRLCRLNESSCSVSSMPRGEYTFVHPGGLTRCLSTENPEYRFQVVPGDLDKLVFQFQGGGACWNEKTAEFACFRQTTVDSKGMFNRDREGNPFENYTIVSVMYCSGDIHLGMANHSWGVQAGWENTKSVLDWTLENFPSVDSLVISGASAGALAAQYMSKFVLTRFEGRYNRALVIADSFAGISPPGSQEMLTQIWNFCATPVLQEYGLVEQCLAGNLTVQDLYLDTIRSFPQVAFASINSKTDLVQILYYDLYVDVENNGALNIEGIRYFVYLNDILSKYNQEPNFVSYLVNGAQHVYLEFDTLYTADPQGEAGRGAVARPTLSNWIGSLLRGEDAVGSVCSGIKYQRSYWGKFLAGVLYCDAAQADKKLQLANSSLLL